MLLVTTRETRRWVIPKGNRMRGLADHEAAAREAYEEAGVSGRIDPAAVGAYRYRKKRSSGSIRTLDVMVYPLAVEEEAERWPEQRERSRRWLTLARAAEIAGETGLAALLADFVPPAEGRLMPLSPWLTAEGPGWRLFRAYRIIARQRLAA